jgi:hypothetical protein
VSPTNDNKQQTHQTNKRNQDESLHQHSTQCRQRIAEALAPEVAIDAKALSFCSHFLSLRI